MEQAIGCHSLSPHPLWSFSIQDFRIVKRKEGEPLFGQAAVRTGGQDNPLWADGTIDLIKQPNNCIFIVPTDS